MTIMAMILLSAAALVAFSHIAALRVHRQQKARKIRVPVAFPVRAHRIR